MEKEEGHGYRSIREWLGVSVEDQATADERIPLLLQTTAAVRWISAEPLLGPVSFRWATWHDYSSREPGYSHGHLDGMRGIDWVVVGGESGPQARPMQPYWARDLRDQCEAAGVPFLFKQWGEWAPEGTTERPHRRVGKKSAGRLLDGVEHNGYPQPSGSVSLNGKSASESFVKAARP